MTDTERERINAICEVAGVADIDDLSDGFHTFRQLYCQRMMLFAAIVRQNKDKAWKSLRHEDGELCFGGGWFIVGIDTPEGSYTYHYENNYYSLFDCEELERGKHWDGHTEKDVTRLLSLPKAQHFQEDTTFSPNNQVNLCDSCTYTYPECPSEKDDVIFGNGIGNDNICACNKYQPTIQPVATDTNVGDTISRQAAIDGKIIIQRTNGVEIYYDEAVPVWYLKNLPSIQPKPKEGEWIPVHPLQGDDPGAYMCSKCKTGMWEIRPSAYHYCPNCGADMRGEQDEHTSK